MPARDACPLVVGRAVCQVRRGTSDSTTRQPCLVRLKRRSSSVNLKSKALRLPGRNAERSIVVRPSVRHWVNVDVDTRWWWTAGAARPPRPRSLRPRPGIPPEARKPPSTPGVPLRASTDVETTWVYFCGSEGVVPVLIPEVREVAPEGKVESVEVDDRLVGVVGVFVPGHCDLGSRM